MGRCENCKWWGKEMMGKSISRGCDHPKLSPSGHDADIDGAIDGECGYAGIYTGPEFGCVHFEAKNATAPQDGVY